jgi:hypothetical protein
MASGISIRGVRVSDEEAGELARRLRSYGDPVGIAMAERLERGSLLGTAVVGTSLPEARVTLNVIEQRVPRGLRDVESALREYVERDDGDTGSSRAA